MTTITLYVEGGGDNNALRTSCRRAFSLFLQKAGLKGCMPRIVACGSRQNAYESFRTAIRNGEKALLLVDSEDSIIIPAGCTEYDVNDMKTWKPWHHLKNRKGGDGNLADNWDKPLGATDGDCHLMVELMEAWFLADVPALEKYYGKGFNKSSLPKNSKIDEISKRAVMDSLKNATKTTQKGNYSKGKHSFSILETIDPSKVVAQSDWAKRFIQLLLEKASTYEFT